jgi:hypothetical protein
MSFRSNLLLVFSERLTLFGYTVMLAVGAKDTTIAG